MNLKRRIIFISVKSIILLILFICLVLVNKAQTPNKQDWKPLKIGDLVPDFKISEIGNYPKKTTQFRSFGNKLIILDFWAPYCEGCVEALPKLAKLQKQFGDKLQILLVNKKTREQVAKVILNQVKLHPLLKDDLMNLPYISHDTLLNTIFPHYFIPHEVWINGKGKVIAITDERQVTERNIHLALTNPIIDLPEKKDFLAQDVSLPLLPQIFDSYSTYSRQLSYYSCLLKYVPGIKPGALSDIDTSKQIFRITRPASPILNLYADALSQSACVGNPFEEAYFDFGKRVILKINDSSRYFYDSSTSYEDWEAANTFVYEAVFPLCERNKAYDYMLTDLDRFFEITGKIEKRKMKCLVLECDGPSQKFAYQFAYRGDSTIKGARRYFDSFGVFHIKGTVFDSFRETLAEYNRDNPLPVINNTGFSGWIDLTISSPLNNIPMLQKELREKYNLILTEKETDADVMILRENNYKERK